MKSYFYLLMTVSVIAVGATGCKCSKKATLQQTAEIQSDVKTTPSNDATLKRATEKEVGTASFSESAMTTGSFALPSVIIYKTKADYSKNVPVGLNEERTSIVSYPGKTDVRGQEPLLLEYGFLLDRRGIKTNAAFLKYTYAEYMALDEIPPIVVLFDAIIDTDPLIEMYHCGKISDFQQGEVAEQLNEMLKKSEGKPEMVFKRLK